MTDTTRTPQQQATLDSFDRVSPEQTTEHPAQAERIERVRLAFKVTAAAVMDQCPEGPVLTVALTQLLETQATAIKAILVCEPPAEPPATDEVA